MTGNFLSPFPKGALYYAPASDANPNPPFLKGGWGSSCSPFLKEGSSSVSPLSKRGDGGGFIAQRLRAGFFAFDAALAFDLEAFFVAALGVLSRAARAAARRAMGTRNGEQLT